LEDLGVGVRITLKYIENKYGGRISAGLIWLKAGNNDSL
jgi:hypothetical protein